MFDTDDEKRRFLASEEFWHDPEYMRSMDEAYHGFMQPRYFDAWRRFCRQSVTKQITQLQEQLMGYDTDSAARKIEDEGADNDRCTTCGCLLFKRELDDDGNEFIVECRNETCKNYLKDITNEAQG